MPLDTQEILAMQTNMYHLPLAQRVERTIDRFHEYLDTYTAQQRPVAYAMLQQSVAKALQKTTDPTARMTLAIID